jgi:hypothetical protein
VFMVSPNSWKRARSPRKTPAGTGACTTTGLCNLHSPKQTAAITSLVVHSLGLFTRVDKGYRDTHPDTWFAPHYSEMLPSEWATHIFGHNFLIGLAHHLYQSMSSAADLGSTLSRQSRFLAAPRIPYSRLSSLADAFSYVTT